MPSPLAHRTTHVLDLCAPLLVILALAVTQSLTAGATPSEVPPRQKISSFGGGPAGRLDDHDRSSVQTSRLGDFDVDCIDYGDYLHWAARMSGAGADEVAVSGGHAYIVNVAGLRVIDIADPEAPQIVGGVDTPQRATSVAVAGGHAYVVDNGFSTPFGFHVVDVSNPQIPRIVGSASMEGNADHVVAAGSLAFFAYIGDWSGLQVVDVSDPENPQFLGSVSAPGTPRGVDVVGNHAYLAADGFGLHVIDISNPQSPQVVGSANWPGEPKDVAVAGSYAYVADGQDSGLAVIDISNPQSPQLVGAVATPGSARGVDVAGGYALVGDGGWGLTAIDISNPFSPVVVGRANTGSLVDAVAISGDHAFSAGSYLCVFDITSSVSPGVIGSIDTQNAHDVAISGDHAYVADQIAGLKVIDISNPGSLQIVGQVDTPDWANRLTVWGTYAYVADEGGGLQVIDISTPQNPRIVGSASTPYAIDVAVSGDHAFMACSGPDRLQVVDISDPENPQLEGSVGTSSIPHGVAVAGSYAYVAADEYGSFQVVDISNPQSPQIVGNVDLPGGGVDVVVSGDRAYVAGQTSSGLQVVDISNPQSPQIVGSISTSDVALQLAIRRDHVYVAGQAGMQVIDVSIPESPRIIGGAITVDHPYLGALGVAVSGDYTFAACSSYGLYVLPAQCTGARTWHVPGDASTIAGGLELAAYGDTVEVACGTYNEIVGLKSGVTLRSETEEPDCVTIDAQSADRVVYCEDVDENATIEGFTITGGLAWRGAGGGGGMYCLRSSPRVVGCVFTGNESQDDGGGISCWDGSSPVLDHCTFTGNSTGTYDSGGALYCTGNSSPSLVGCILEGNSAGDGGGIACWDGSSPEIELCTFTGNSASVYGGALFCTTNSSPSLVSCTLEGNAAGASLPGGGIHTVGTASVTVESTIIAFSTVGRAVSCDLGAPVTLSCCDIYGNAGGDWVGCIQDQYGIGGNISDDPLFCDRENGDLTLDANSPCAAAQNPTCGLVGAWPVGCPDPVFIEIVSGPLGTEGSREGVAWGDADGDGDLDIYVTSSDNEPNLLIRNDGGGTFSDATPAILADGGSGKGSAWGDYDNDGDLDLYLANDGTANHLFRNDGPGEYVDVTTGPLGDVGVSQTVTWVDHDNDGDIDLFVTGSSNRLLRNDGASVFVDATTGPLGDAGNSTGAAWGDYDDDGDPDLYIARFLSANRLFRNDGAGVFVDVTPAPLADPEAGVGVAWGDYDDDGDLDLYLANHMETADKLFRNEGNGAFTDVTTGPLGGDSSSMGVTWGDYDNDGDLDLFVTGDGSSNQLYRNEDGQVFTEVTPDCISGGTRGGTTAAFADYDSDGRIDLFVTSNGHPRLFRNVLETGHWLHVDLVGTDSNRNGIGARVRVVTEGASQIREVTAGSGYLSEDSRTAEFGLGASTVVDTVRVFWPSGVIQDIVLVDVDRRLVLTEHSAVGISSPSVAPPMTNALYPNVPNPFNPNTTIPYALSRDASVWLKIYDPSGRQVRVLVGGATVPPGRHQVVWNGRDDRGWPVAAGVYLYRLEAGSYAETRRMLLIK